MSKSSIGFSGPFGPVIIGPIIHNGSATALFKARLKSDDSPVAFKVLRPSSSDSAREAFETEGYIGSKLCSPQLLRIHETGSHKRVLFQVQELALGRLSDELKGQALDWREALRVLADAARGLAAVHQAKLAHRDLRPKNLYRTATGIKLGGFGTCCPRDSSTARAVRGHPAYMAPAQFSPNSKLGPPTDLYSLGVSAFEILTGGLPFPVQDRELRAMLEVHERARPPALAALVPGLPPALQLLVERLLAKKPEQRYQDAAELANLLDQLADGSIQELPDRAPEQRSDIGAGQIQLDAPSSPQEAPEVEDPAPKTAAAPGPKDRRQTGLALAIFLVVLIAGGLHLVLSLGTSRPFLTGVTVTLPAGLKLYSEGLSVTKDELAKGSEVSLVHSFQAQGKLWVWVEQGELAGYIPAAGLPAGSLPKGLFKVEEFRAK